MRNLFLATLHHNFPTQYAVDTRHTFPFIWFDMRKSISYPQISQCVSVISKSVPLQAQSGPEGSRKLRFPDFMTTLQDGDKVLSFTHLPPLPPGKVPGTHFCWVWVDPRAIVRSVGFYVKENSNDTSWDRTSDLCYHGPPPFQVLAVNVA